MISFKKVFVKYTKEFYALSNINLDIEDGEILALCGPEDSGKTCFLRLLAGIETQEKGEIYINDIPVNKIDFSANISMGYVPYKANFLEKKSVYDNLKYVLSIRGEDKKTINDKINKAIIDFRLESIVNEKAHKLTLFQRYLVSIARLSFRNLDILLIDNIFEELSKDEIAEFLKLVKKYLYRKGITVVYATSDKSLAKKVAQKIVYLDYGVITSQEENKKKEK